MNTTPQLVRAKRHQKVERYMQQDGPERLSTEDGSGARQFDANASGYHERKMIQEMAVVAATPTVRMDKQRKLHEHRQKWQF